MSKQADIVLEDLSEPLGFPVDAYVSREYAEAEGERLWAKVWQHAGRVEDIPEVGDFITYEIANDSILIVRAAADRLKAYHNVCPHRGRRLVSTPRHGTDPDKCIYEAFAIERYAKGAQPKTEWVYAEPTEEHWRKVIAQDFSNMEMVQLGLRSRGFRGNLPNPHQERKVTNLHRNLAKYTGIGAPVRLE